VVLSLFAAILIIVAVILLRMLCKQRADIKRSYLYFCLF